MSQQLRERGVLTLTIDDATQCFQSVPAFMTERRSNPIVLCGAKWDLMTKRSIYKAAPYLQITAQRSADDRPASPWSFKVAVQIRVCSSTADDKVKDFMQELSNDRTVFGFDRFLSIEVSLQLLIPKAHSKVFTVLFDIGTLYSGSNICWLCLRNFRNGLTVYKLDLTPFFSPFLSIFEELIRLFL